VEQKAAQDKESEEGIRLKDIHYVRTIPLTGQLGAGCFRSKLSKDQQFVTFLNFTSP